MIIRVLKKDGAGCLEIAHVPPNSGCPSSRLSIGGSPSDINLVLLRVSLREPQLVLFQHPNLRAGPVRDVFLACLAGTVSSQ